MANAHDGETTGDCFYAIPFVSDPRFQFKP
jgi:hypothetical protein